MTDTEIGRATVVLAVDDRLLNAGLARAHAETQKFAQAGASHAQSFATGWTNSMRGGFANAGKAAAQDFTNALVAGMPGGNIFANTAIALGPTGMIAGAAIAGAAVISTVAMKAAAEWQRMTTAISRTTGLEGKPLEGLMNGLQELRMQMGLTREGAAAMAQAAGSIGVGQAKFQRGDLEGYKKELVDFVQATQMVSGAFGMSSEATAEGLGKMGSVVLENWNQQRKARGEEELSWSQFAMNVGGSIDSLANQMGSKEEEIITAMRHVSTSVAQYAPTEESYGKWTALASYLIETGDTADHAGETIKDAMEYISRDEKGGISALLGTDTAGLMGKMKSDAVGTMQELAKAIAQVPESQRPDIYKMFGITGQGVMKKMVADIENETGRLDFAIEIGVKGFKESELQKSWDKVLADANTQAGRITQVFQVALEKMGTVALPAVTAGMEAIADWGEAAIENASNLWGAGQGAWENISQGSLGTITLNGVDYEVGLSGIREKTAEEVAAGTKEGAEDGFGDAKGAAKDVGETAGEAAGKSIGEAFKEGVTKLTNSGVSSELAWMMAGAGLSDVQALAAINASGSTAPEKQGYSRSWSVGGTEYQWIMESAKGGQDVYYQLLADGQHGQQVWNQGMATRTFWQPEEVLSLLGLPVPDEGTAAYYRMKGDTVRAKLLEITGEWQFDVKKLAAKASTGEGSFKTMLDIMTNPAYSSQFPDAKSLIDAMNQLGTIATSGSYSYSGAKSLFGAYSTLTSENGFRGESYSKMFDSIAEDYVDSMKSGITNADKFMKSAYNDMSNDLSSALEDGFLEAGPAAEEGALKANLAFMKVLEKKYPIEYEASGLDKVRADTEKALQGIDTNIEIEVTAKAVWEDWTSEQYKAKWTYENQDWLKQLTPGERDAFVREVSRQSDLLQTGTAQEKANAQSFLGALDGVRVGLQNQTLSELPYFDQSLVTLASMATSVAEISPALDRLAAVFSSAAAGGKGMTAGESFYDWSYKSQYTSGYGTSKAGAKVSIGNYSAPGAPALPVFGEGGYTGSYEGLAYVHPNEMVIPLDQVPGLYPKPTNAPAGSMQDILVDQIFAQYPVKITAPTSYRWSQYPAAPTVSMTGTEPVAWLADQQKTGMEYLSGQIRELQIASIGRSQVLPWFARGFQDQPAWWVEAATAASPKYASSWAAQKGGEVPKLGKDVNDIAPADAWSRIYDDSGTCIGFVPPDPSLKFTPGPKYADLSEGAPIDETLQEIAINTEKTSQNMIAQKSGSSGSPTLRAAIVGAEGERQEGSGNMVWKDKSGAVMAYDPRTDTCDTLGFVAPEPSLKTTDPFYLGLTKNNPAAISWEEGGWAGQVATPLTEELARLMAENAKSQEDTSKNTAETARNTELAAKYQATMASVFGVIGSGGGSMIYGNGGGGSGIIGLANRGGGLYFGGTSISGGGAWIGGGASASGWGAAASRAASSGQSSSWGSVQWAEGGIVDEPTFGVFGEAGREAFVPLDDKSAGWRILSKILPEFGVRAFAQGGIVGRSASIPAPTRNITLNYSPIIQGSNLSKSELLDILDQHKNELLSEAEERLYNASRR